jgi:hypothetical protein
LLDSTSKAMWTTNHLGIASSSLNALVWDGGLIMTTTLETKLGPCCYHKGSSSHVCNGDVKKHMSKVGGGLTSTT